MLIIPLKVEFTPRRTAWLCHVVAAVLTYRMVAPLYAPVEEDIPLRVFAEAVANGDPVVIASAALADLLHPQLRFVHLLFAAMMLCLGPALEDRLTAPGLLAVLAVTTAVTPMLAESGLLGLPHNFDLITGTAIGMAGVMAWVLRNDEISVFYFLPYASLPCFRAGQTTTHVSVAVVAFLAVAWFAMMWAPGRDPGPYPYGYVGGPLWSILYPMLAALAAFALESLLGGGRGGADNMTASRSRRSASAARS